MFERFFFLRIEDNLLCCAVLGVAKCLVAPTSAWQMHTNQKYSRLYLKLTQVIANSKALSVEILLRQGSRMSKRLHSQAWEPLIQAIPLSDSPDPSDISWASGCPAWVLRSWVSVKNVGRFSSLPSPFNAEAPLSAQKAVLSSCANPSCEPLGVAVLEMVDW